MPYTGYSRMQKDSASSSSSGRSRKSSTTSRASASKRSPSQTSYSRQRRGNVYAASSFRPAAAYNRRYGHTERGGYAPKAKASR